MNVFEMIVIVVVVTAIAGVLKHWTRGRNGETDRDYSDVMSDLGLEEDYYSKKQMQPHLERIRKLEERVQVLERIATDKGSNLAREIDSLA